jgi:hypothetical protein
MWSTQIPANYRKVDLQVMSVGVAEAVLPSPTVSIVPKTERVMLQARADNISPIYIGKTGVLSDGTTGAFELPPGAVMWLLGKDIASYFAISPSAAQLLYVTHMSGVE